MDCLGVRRCQRPIRAAHNWTELTGRDTTERDTGRPGIQDELNEEEREICCRADWSVPKE